MQPINDNDGIYNYQIFREVDGQVGESQGATKPLYAMSMVHPNSWLSEF